MIKKKLILCGSILTTLLPITMAISCASKTKLEESTKNSSTKSVDDNIDNKKIKYKRPYYNFFIKANSEKKLIQKENTNTLKSLVFTYLNKNDELDMKFIWFGIKKRDKNEIVFKSEGKIHIKYDLKKEEYTIRNETSHDIKPLFLSFTISDLIIEK